jgi:malate dehydrogenase (oxaloacetate-decarboxylating)
MVRATSSSCPGARLALVPRGGNHTEQHDPAARFADDPASAGHGGGKLEIRPTRPIRSIDDLALTYSSSSLTS